MDPIVKTAVNHLNWINNSQMEQQPILLNYFNEAGLEWRNEDETPWCSLFVNWIAKINNCVAPDNTNPGSWLRIGKQIKKPRLGDVVVFWEKHANSWRGKVGFFFGYSHNGTSFYCLEGMAKDYIGINKNPTAKILGFRRLNPINPDKLPNEVLKYGCFGPSVEKLQIILSRLGHYAGKIDGHYQIETKIAVQKLQSTIPAIEINGVYDRALYEALKQKLKDSERHLKD